MNKDALEQYVRPIVDFPKPGIVFRDITPLLGSYEAFEFALHEMQKQIEVLKPTALAGIESRGFIFGAPLAQRMHLPFIPIRKPGKLPAKTVSTSYALEYGSGSLEMHEDALSHGARVCVIDDLLATGGTAAAAAKLITSVGAHVVGYSFFIELAQLTGRVVLQPVPVNAVLSY
jgi:adenine phosphoribosyltransferase